MNGFVTDAGRINDIIGVSRSLGDFFLQVPRKRSNSEVIILENEYRKFDMCDDRIVYNIKDAFELQRDSASPSFLNQEEKILIQFFLLMIYSHVFLLKCIIQKIKKKTFLIIHFMLKILTIFQLMKN